MSDYIKSFDEIAELMTRKYKYFKNIQVGNLSLQIKFEVSAKSYLIFRDSSLHLVIYWKPIEQKENRYQFEKMFANQQQLFDYLQDLEKVAKGYEERKLFG